MWLQTDFEFSHFKRKTIFTLWRTFCIFNKRRRKIVPPKIESEIIAAPHLGERIFPTSKSLHSNVFVATSSLQWSLRKRRFYGSCGTVNDERFVRCHPLLETENTQHEGVRADTATKRFFPRWTPQNHRSDMLSPVLKQKKTFWKIALGRNIRELWAPFLQ